MPGTAPFRVGWDSGGYSFQTRVAQHARGTVIWQRSPVSQQTWVPPSAASSRAMP